MKIIVLLLLSILATASGSAQQWVGLKSSQVQKIHLNKKESKPTLRYDETGFCVEELYRFQSKSALEKKLLQVLQQKKWAWVRINENQYVSDYKGQLLMEIQEEGTQFTLQFLRTAWTPELYEILLKN